MTFKEQIEEYLSSLPSKWREQLTTVLCEIKEDKESVDCEQVKDCETVTSLSDFTISGSTVSIKYTGEDGIQVTRSFNVDTLLNNSIDGLDPNCLTDETTWNTLSFVEKIQLFIDSRCDCCTTTTTTTTTIP